MNTKPRWANDPKRAAALKKAGVYLLMLLRILVVLIVWLVWEFITQETILSSRPLRSWVVPPVSAALFCLGYLTVRRYVKDFRTAYRFRPLGAAGVWVAFAWVAFAVFRYSFLVAYVQIFSLTGSPPSELDKYRQFPYGWAAVLLLTCIFAPVVEELTFRGLIQRTLERRCRPAVAITTAAALFALVHGDREMVIPHFIGGLIYGYTVFITNSVWAGVIMHAGHNVLTTALENWVAPIGVAASRYNMFMTASLSLVMLLILLWLGSKFWVVRRTRARLSRVISNEQDSQLDIR